MMNLAVCPSALHSVYHVWQRCSQTVILYSLRINLYVLSTQCLWTVMNLHEFLYYAWFVVLNHIWYSLPPSVIATEYLNILYIFMNFCMSVSKNRKNIHLCMYMILYVCTISTVCVWVYMNLLCYLRNQIIKFIYLKSLMYINICHWWNVLYSMWHHKSACLFI